MGWGNQHGGLGNFREDPVLSYPRAIAWSTPFPVSQPSHEGFGHPHPWYRVLWEEVLVAAFEDIHLRIVEAGVVIGGSVSFPDETAPGTSRDARVRAGCAVGCIRGPAPCTHSSGNHRRLDCRNVSHKNTFCSVWLTGYTRGWGDRKKQIKGALCPEDSYKISVQDIASGPGKWRQKGDK